MFTGLRPCWKSWPDPTSVEDGMNAIMALAVTANRLAAAQDKRKPRTKRRL